MFKCTQFFKLTYPPLPHQVVDGPVGGDFGIIGIAIEDHDPGDVFLFLAVLSTKHSKLLKTVLTHLL